MSHLRLSTISDLNPHRISNSKKKNLSNRSINKKLDFCGPVSHWRKVQYRIWNPHQISKSKKKKKLFKLVHKQEIGLLWSSESFEGKYDIKFGIPIKFLSKKNKLLKLIQKQRNYALIQNAKIVMFKIDLLTFRYWLYSCFAFYKVPNC